jgi:hypothetical protein
MIRNVLTRRVGRSSDVLGIIMAVLAFAVTAFLAWLILFAARPENAGAAETQKPRGIDCGPGMVLPRRDNSGLNPAVSQTVNGVVSGVPVTVTITLIGNHYLAVNTLLFGPNPAVMDRISYFAVVFEQKKRRKAPWKTQSQCSNQRSNGPFANPNIFGFEDFHSWRYKNPLSSFRVRVWLQLANAQGAGHKRMLQWVLPGLF